MINNIKFVSFISGLPGNDAVFKAVDLSLKANSTEELNLMPVHLDNRVQPLAFKKLSYTGTDGLATLSIIGELSGVYSFGLFGRDFDLDDE